MNWLRSRLRAWLGIEFAEAECDARGDKLEDEIDALRSELDSFKSALKAKAAESRTTRQVYTDFESSQQAVLAEYEEKPNVNHV